MCYNPEWSALLLVKHTHAHKFQNCTSKLCLNKSESNIMIRYNNC